MIDVIKHFNFVQKKKIALPSMRQKKCKREIWEKVKRASKKFCNFYKAEKIENVKDVYAAK